MVFTEKRKIISRDESKPTAHFAIFGRSQFQFKEHTINFLDLTLFHKWLLVDWDLDEKNWTCSYREIWGWIWLWMQISSRLGIFGLSIFWREDKNAGINFKHLTETSREEIRTFFTEKYEIENGDISTFR